MTEDIDSYKDFDFNAEASGLMKALGPLAEKAMLVQVDVIPPHITIGNFIGDDDLVKTNGDFAHKLVADHYGRYPNSTSWDFMATDAEGKVAGHILAFKKQEISDEMLGKDNDALMHLWILYHEVGHVLLENGPDNDQTHPDKECAADAFAALCFLQRFGATAAPFIAGVSWARAHEAITSAHTDHLTTFALDAIAADAAHLDLSTMKPADMVRLAGTYAQAWTPKINALSHACSLFDQTKGMRYTDIIKTCLASPSALTVYLGGVLLQGFKNGAVLQGQTRNFDPAVWQNLSEAFNQRCAETKLSAAFRRNTSRQIKRAPAKMMAAPRTRNSKPLTVNF